MVLNPDGSWEKLSNRLVPVFFDGVPCIAPYQEDAAIILHSEDPANISYEWANWIYRESRVLKKVYLGYKPSENEIKEIQQLLKPLIQRLDKKPVETKRRWFLW